MNYQAHKYGIPNFRPRRANFLPRNPQLRPLSRYPQQVALYPMPNNPRALNSFDSSEEWEGNWKIFNRIRKMHVMQNSSEFCFLLYYTYSDSLFHTDPEYHPFSP
jgi:hypothetical protein